METRPGMAGAVSGAEVHCRLIVEGWVGLVGAGVVATWAA